MIEKDLNSCEIDKGTNFIKYFPLNNIDITIKRYKNSKL